MSGRYAALPASLRSQSATLCAQTPLPSTLMLGGSWDRPTSSAQHALGTPEKFARLIRSIFSPRSVLSGTGIQIFLRHRASLGGCREEDVRLPRYKELERTFIPMRVGVPSWPHTDVVGAGTASS
jgi:hypothetical protein